MVLDTLRPRGFHVVVLWSLQEYVRKMYKSTGNMHTVQGLRIHVLQETQKPTIEG